MGNTGYDIDNMLDRFFKVSKEIIGVEHIEKACALLLDELYLTAPVVMGVFKVDEEGHFSFLQGKGFSNDKLFNLKLLEWWERLLNAAIIDKTAVFIKKGEDGWIFDDENPFAAFMLLPLESSRRVEAVLAFADYNGQFLRKDLELQLRLLSNPLIAEIVSLDIYGQLEELFLSTVRALASAVDAKHPYTRGHSERVTRYSVAIAEKLELGRKDIKNLKLSALLHDVGKIGISEAVLDKHGHLDDKEYTMIKEHPVIGAKIVGQISNSSDIVPGILDHHERYNGNGYPNGKKGKEISLFGRIIAVADAFDAMTSTRSYRKALPFQIAIEEIVDKSGEQFDPSAVKAFVSAYKEQKDIWQRENIIESTN